MKTFALPSRTVALLLLLPVVALPARAQDAPKWETLKSAYDYEKKPVEVKETPQEDVTSLGNAVSVTHTSFTNGKGHTVTGLFLRPKAEPLLAKGYPVVLVLHGLGSDKETMARYYGRYFAAKGMACLALDAHRHGERREPGQDRAMTGPTFVEVIRETVGDYRLALDWLATRKDVDSARVGAFGYSMGAMMTSILAGVDERIKAVTLCVGGDPVITSLNGMPSKVKETGQTTAPSLYVGQIAPRPLLMVNAKDDRVMLREYAERLHDAAKKENREIRWVSGGHMLGPEDARNAMDWLIGKVTAL